MRNLTTIGTTRLRQAVDELKLGVFSTTTATNAAIAESRRLDVKRYLGTIVSLIAQNELREKSSKVMQDTFVNSISISMGTPLTKTAPLQTASALVQSILSEPKEYAVRRDFLIGLLDELYKEVVLALNMQDYVIPQLADEMIEAIAVHSANLNVFMKAHERDMKNGVLIYEHSVRIQKLLHDSVVAVLKQM